MERIKQIIRKINSLANDPEASIDSILTAISAGVYDYFHADKNNLGQFFSYIVLYQSYSPLRIPAVHPQSYRDALKSSFENQAESQRVKRNYQAFSNRESLRLGNLTPEASPNLPSTLSQLTVPIIAYRRRPRPEFSHETIGLICIESDKADAFTEAHQLAVELLADYAAGIIETQRIALSLEALQKATHELSSALNLETIADICGAVVNMTIGILNRLHQEVAFCHVGLLEQDGDERVLSFAASFDKDKRLLAVLGENKIRLDQSEGHKAGIIGRCVLENETINIGYVHDDPDYIALDERVQSQLAIPIRFENTVLGAISVEYFEAHAFDINEQRILESIASAAAIAIQNLRLRLALEAISTAASGYQDISEILKLVREKTIELATFSQGKTIQAAIGVVSKEGGVKYDYPLIAPESPTLLLKAGEGLSGRVIRTGKEVYSGNVRRDSEYVARSEETLSEFLAPITLGKSVIAILSIQSSVENAFGEYSFQMVRLLARQAALAIRNHRLFRSLRKLHEISSQSRNTQTGIGSMTTEQLPLVEESEDKQRTTDTQIFPSLYFEDNQPRLLMNALDEQDLALILYDITRDIISFNGEVQFENMVIAFVPKADEKIAHLYDFAQIERSKRPRLEIHELDELSMVSAVLKNLSIMSDKQTKAPSLPAYQQYGSYIFAPMVLDRVGMGAIGIFGQRKDAFTEDDEWMLQSIADRAAEAYSNFRRVRRLNEGVLALNEIDTRIVKLLLGEANENNLLPIWDFILEMAIKLTEAEGASLFLYHPENHELEKIADEGLHQNSPVGHRYELHEEGLVSVAAARKKAITTQADLKMPLRSPTLQSAVAIPLLADERELGEEADGKLGLVGVLSVRSARDNAFNNEKMDLLKALAGQAVVAMRYAKLLARMGELFSTNLRLSSLSYEQAAETILAKALEFIAPKVGLRGMVYSLDIAKAQLNRLCQAGFDDDNPRDAAFLRRSAELTLNAKNGISEAAYERKRHVVRDVLQNPHYQIFYENSPVRSVLSIAIYGSREHIEGSEESPKVLRGVLVVMSSEANAFNPIDRRLLIYFANQVELAWSYVAQRSRMIELATINQEWGQIAHEDSAGREQTWANLHVWDKVKRLIGADAGVIFERHQGKGSLHLVDNRRYAANFRDIRPEIMPNEGVAGWVLRTGTALNIPDVDMLPQIEYWDTESPAPDSLYYLTGIYHLRANDNNADTFMGMASQSVLAVPMIDREGKLRGVIQVESPVSHAFDANDMRFLQVLANQAWSVMDTRQTQRKQWEANVLPTFFAMLHDQKGTLAGIHHLMSNNSLLDPQQRFGATMDDLQRYVTLIEEAKSAFDALASKKAPSKADILPIESALRYIQAQYQEKHPEFEDAFLLDCHDCEDCCVAMDMRLIYVFRNLLSNAVTYGQAPYILGAKVEKRTGMIAFYVRDAGNGIDSKILEKIFEPKFGRTSGGWGMGLWFTQMFVQALGGTIEVTSSTKQGTRFSFWIPLADC